jgi:cystathionine beta-lyase/cystathionine gamma-synthase
MSSMHKETQCVHSGTYRDNATGGVNTPIYPSSSYEYLDRDGGIPYPRNFNTPNQEAVVTKLCALEGAEDGLLLSSGMAAISTTVLALVNAGDHVIMLDQLYGGTHAFATDEFDRLGIRYTFVATDADAVLQAVKPETRLIVVESPTNPLLGIIDIRRITEFARKRGVITIFDNTFATPINQNPLAMGIDVVVHSATKYLGGHSDLCCGLILTSYGLIQPIRRMARHLGGSVNAMTGYLLERSLKTLAVRVERQTQNAVKIAEYLAVHPAVRSVYYPGLEDFAGHAIAKTQMRGFGAMLSFELDDSPIQPNGFLKRLDFIRPAISLGGVESIICAPSHTSHLLVSAEERQRIGISDSLLRLSVGIEHVDDIIADLQAALP